MLVLYDRVSLFGMLEVESLSFIVNNLSAGIQDMPPLRAKRALRQRVFFSQTKGCSSWLDENPDQQSLRRTITFNNQVFFSENQHCCRRRCCGHCTPGHYGHCFSCLQFAVCGAVSRARCNGQHCARCLFPTCVGACPSGCDYHCTCKLGRSSAAQDERQKAGM